MLEECERPHSVAKVKNNNLKRGIEGKYVFSID